MMKIKMWIDGAPVAKVKDKDPKVAKVKLDNIFKKFR